MLGIIIISILVVLFIGCLYLCYHIEKKHFNNGICPRCGNTLHYFDTDSQGGKGYTCDNCNYTTWVSWFNPEKYKK